MWECGVTFTSGCGLRLQRFSLVRIDERPTPQVQSSVRWHQLRIVKRSPSLQDEATLSTFSTVIGQLAGVAYENAGFMLHTRDCFI